MFAYYVSSLEGVRGVYRKYDKSWPENQREGGIRSLSYVSIYPNFIFRHYHKLNVKHVTTSNRKGEVWLLIVFSSLYYPCFSFIPIPLIDKDVNWKLSWLLHQHLCLFENSTLLFRWMIWMCNFLHGCMIICFYWLNTSKKTSNEW